jgi:glycosyltransferase involved in cell wall biosynthesis
LKVKPKVAILRGPLLSPYEMQSYEPLKKEFELVAFTPHQTNFDVSSIDIPKESLWCPIAGQVAFERERRKLQVGRDALTGNTHSFCGLAERLKGFDLYHIMDQPYCFSFEAALAKRDYGGKLVVSQWENIPHHNEEKFMERHIKKTVKEQADLFLVMSGLAERALLEEGVTPEKIKRLYGGVDVDHFSPGKADEKLRKSLGIPASGFLVLYVGRISQSKGIFTLLQAAKELVSEDPDYHFLLVGRDEVDAAGWAAENGLGHSVHLAGFVPYDQMPKYYRLGRVLVLPSLPDKRQQEQFGYALAEALACGVPVVGSDCGAVPEVVGDPNRIFPAGSVEGLVKILKKLKRTHSTSMKTKARQRATELFSAEKLSKSLARIYWELLEGK